MKKKNVGQNLIPTKQNLIPTKQTKIKQNSKSKWLNLKYLLQDKASFETSVKFLYEYKNNLMSFETTVAVKTVG